MKNRNNSSGLRSPGLLGKKPIIGLILFVIGMLIFIALAFNLIYNGPLIRWDLSIANSFHSLALNSPVWVIDIMIAGYYIGLHGIIIVSILLGLYFLYKKFWCEFFMVAVSLGISGLIFIFLSHIFNRPRPFLLFDKPIWAGSPNIPGFPSGHTLSIIVLCGLFVYLIYPKIKSFFGKVILFLIALLVVVYIGFSRLYVGDHYLTDIVAGYAVGIAWFGLSLTLVELIFKKIHKEGNVNNG